MNQIEFYLKVREAISNEQGLIAGKFWNEEGMPCAVGSLCPKEKRFNAVLAQHKFFNEMYDNDEGFSRMEVADENNDFDGTPEQRKTHMLQWLDQKLAEAALETIDLNTPHAKVLA